MFSRRTFLTSLLVAMATSTVDARWFHRLYRAGIADSLLSGKADESESLNHYESMSEIFESPGQPKCQLEFGTAAILSKRLEDQQINFAFMPGIEYAWNKATSPNMIPLVTAYTTDIRMKACVLVETESQYKALLDLRGKLISLPERLPKHTYIYLNQRLEKSGVQPTGFFQKKLVPANSDEGIESVIDGHADAILLDYDSWKGYQRLKPARSKKVRMLGVSSPFPTPVILYSKQNSNRLEIPLLKIGLCAVHEKPFARQVLNFLGISRFIPHTFAYQQVIEDILWEIPEPVTCSDLISKEA